MDAIATPLPFDMPTPAQALPAVSIDEVIVMAQLEREAAAQLTAWKGTEAGIADLAAEVSALASIVRSRP